MTVGLNCTEALTLKQADRQSVFADIYSLGIKSARVEIPLYLILGKTAVPGAVNLMMSDLFKSGLEPLVVLAHSTKPSTFSVSTPPVPNVLAVQSAVTLLARTYPQVTYWESWNEQNNMGFFYKGNPEAFVPIQKSIYYGIKGVNPSAKIILGGLAANSTVTNKTSFIPRFPFVIKVTNVSPVDWLTRAYAAGIKDLFDILGVHPYSLNAGFKPLPWAQDNPYVRIQDLWKVMYDNGDDEKDIWATEYGYKTDSFTELEQVDYLRGQTDFLRSRVERQYIYTYRDGIGGNYGLTAKPGYKKLSYSWLKGYGLK